MKGSENQLDQILSNWLINEASPEELEILKEWAGQSEENLETLETLKRVWKEKNSEPVLVNVEDKINEIWKKGKLEKARGFVGISSFLKYAAVLTLLVCASYGVLYWKNHDFEPQTPIVYSQPHYVIKENPAGQKSRITLPDGSIAFLNSKSSIKFLEGFADSDRRVYLEGEAFFEVVRDENHPFKVHVSQATVEVLGTSFNVNQSIESVAVALVSGKVQFKDTLGHLVAILPEEMVLMEKDGTLTKSQFDLMEIAGWKDNYLVFKNDGIEQVRDKLANWYGLEVELEGEFSSSWSYSGIYRDENLENTLEGISQTSDIQYALNGKVLKIKCL